MGGGRGIQEDRASWCCWRMGWGEAQKCGLVGLLGEEQGMERRARGPRWVGCGGSSSSAHRLCLALALNCARNTGQTSLHLCLWL